MRPHGSPETLEKRRLRAISLVQDGLGPGDIATRIGVDRRSVHRWLAAYRVGGIDSLAPTPASGRPPRLTPTERKKLERFLLQGASSFGYANDLWTCPRVAVVIRRRFRVTYHVDHIGRLLRSLGFSPQRPERRARERDEKAIRGWVKTDWPRVKKRLEAEGQPRLPRRKRASDVAARTQTLGTHRQDSHPLASGPAPGSGCR